MKQSPDVGAWETSLERNMLAAPCEGTLTVMARDLVRGGIDPVHFNTCARG